MMNEAFIFDAIRTPRGRGKSQGALHEVKPITLLSGLLKTLCCFALKIDPGFAPNIDPPSGPIMA